MTWYYSTDGGQQVGPVDQTEFDALVQSGKITESTMVWREGTPNWTKYGDLYSGSAAGVAAPEAAAIPVPATTYASPATASAPMAAEVGAVLATHRCVECGQTFEESEMVAFDNAWVCAGCKPRYVQKLKEGVAPVGLLNYAGFWIRAGAKMIDGIILQVFNMIIRAALGWPFVGAPAHPSPTTASLISISAFVVALLFAVFFNGRFGATPGKLALKLKIVRPDGSAITYGRALGRYFAEILSSLILCIGYMMAGWDEEKRALHDRVCDTRVIRL